MYAENEIEVSHHIIERQRKMHEKLFAELKATKTVLEVPSLRDQLPKTNMHGTSFAKFTKTLGELYRNTLSVVVDKDELCECGDNNIAPRTTRNFNKGRSRVPISVS